ncbi:MAG: hypothetical protein JO189_15725 [Deltaproteobacteria bacterium]|nr:hypothetical protein [Deltaproteobacteria bacterium]
MMTEDELIDVGQMVCRFILKGTGCILVIIPPHDAGSHPDGCCRAQTTSNLGCTAGMQSVLRGVADMFEQRMHEPMSSGRLSKCSEHTGS